ncbi:ATP-binding cassette sub-family G member 5 isoform X2 [Brevipalpus obovatus]
MNYITTGPNGTSHPQSYHMLELIGVSHTGPVVPSKEVFFWSKLTGSVAKGLILKDVSFEVYSSEVMAILGSKGSGKQALIDVISHRVSGQGSTKGQILLNDVPLTLRLFQEQCGFVSRSTQLIEGLTVRQTLHYMAQMTMKTSDTIKKTRVKQVLADLALSGLYNRKVEHLNPSEAKRLAIGMQIVRDPLLLILDNPTSDLDPLNTYFVISILSNHAKKYGRIVILTMDKPRSDIFPFLDRVTYLCLGDIVYTGSAKMMVDYFRNIGFPCPEMENPLMFYLCLSTVDRRNRECFIDSSGQIASLVDKFKQEGLNYRKYTAPVANGNQNGPNGMGPSIPLTAYGRASSWNVMFSLINRQFSSSFTWINLFRRILLLPLFFLFLFLFILPKLQSNQQSFQTRSGLFLNFMTTINFLVPAITTYSFSSHRNRFYEESSRLSLYRGPLFIFTQIITSLPFNLITSLLCGCVSYWVIGLRHDTQWLERWGLFSAIIWALYTFAEQHTLAIMCLIKSPFIAAVTSSAFMNIYMVLGSAFLRSMLSAPDWMGYLNMANIYYYAYWSFSFLEYHDNNHLTHSPTVLANGALEDCPVNVIPGRCMFINGTHFLSQRFREGIDSSKNLLPEWSLTHYKNYALTFMFILSSYCLNTFVYIIPIPGSLKSKFRD